MQKNITLQFYMLLCLIAMTNMQCARTAFSPIWYSVSPQVLYDVQAKGDWIGAFQYYDADNGGGTAGSLAYSPVNHLLVGGGFGTLSNKGTLYIDTEIFPARSRQWQGEIFGGGYINSESKVIGAQCVAGVSYSNAASFLKDKRQLRHNYQKLYLQPSVSFRLPNQMSLQASYRLSQLYFTRSQIMIGLLPSEVITLSRNVTAASPFLLRELSLGYHYQTGPLKTGLIYSLSSPLKNSDLGQLDYQVVTTTFQLNLTEMRKIAKKNKQKTTVVEE